MKIGGRLARLARYADLDDPVEACPRVFASDAPWTVVRGSNLEEGESQACRSGAGTWTTPIRKSNLTRRLDFARFMVGALENDALVHEAPAILGSQTPPPHRAVNFRAPRHPPTGAMPIGTLPRR